MLLWLLRAEDIDRLQHGRRSAATASSVTSLADVGSWLDTDSFKNRFSPLGCLWKQPEFYSITQRLLLAARWVFFAAGCLCYVIGICLLDHPHMTEGTAFQLTHHSCLRQWQLARSCANGLALSPASLSLQTLQHDTLYVLCQQTSDACSLRSYQREGESDECH